MRPFELTTEQMRATRRNKWHRYSDDVLPAWVADMDLAVAEPVQRAMRRLVDQMDYGYGLRVGEETLAAAFAERMATRFNWQVDPSRVQATAELIQVLFSCTMAFTDPGDGVVVQPPIYPPFLMAIEQTGRRQVDNPLLDTGSRFEMDVDNLREVVDGRTKMIYFCNPHNPTGRVFERAELEALAEVVLERDLLVISDEIHADLIYDGKQHIPFETLGPEIAARTITTTSATKSFNIAGLRTALMYFGSDQLRERFYQRIPERLLGQVNIPGIDATVAGWRHGQPWLDEVMQLLAENRERVYRFLASELPEIKSHKPEGTYLAWLDCRALNLQPSPYAYFLEQGKLGFNDGNEFGLNGPTCVRLNFGTSQAILEEVLGRLASAVREARAAAV